MPRIDSEKFYKSAIEMHGISPKGVNWISKETQELRFEVILNMLPKNITSLVDAGCGFGDFYLYMKEKKRLPNSYTGIDSITDICSIASKRTDEKIIKADICRDLIPYADYYICSGAMNILNTFETLLFIRNCFEASGKAFIFNILHGEKESSTYNYVTSKQINYIAKELGVKKMKLRDDYMKNDMTVGFFK